MFLQLIPAQDIHCTFARDLTRRAMLPYYREFDLLWIEDAFDAAWGWREQWLVIEGDTLLGFAASARTARRCSSASCTCCLSTVGEGR